MAQRTHVTAPFTVVLLALILAAEAGYQQVQLPLKELPQEHEYQRGLREFIGSLKAEDLAVELLPVSLSPIEDQEALYRLWVLAKHLPQLSAVTLPAEPFTLDAIEGEEGLRVPVAPSQSQMLAWLSAWDYPGNTYKGSRALKLRGLVLAAIDMAMLDYLYEHDPRGADRADYLGGNLIWIGYTYLHCRDVLTVQQRAAFEAGIRKLVEGHLFRWGPKGSMTDMDLFAPVGLWYLSQAMGDPAFSKACKDYSRQLFEDERYFHPAGYFVDNGCFDVSYNGISIYFGVWAAMASDWDFTQEALRKTLRLRAHLCFLAPDGSETGPSAMSSRTSADSAHDQWQFAHRQPAEGMIADESIYRSPIPDKPTMQNAHERVVSTISAAIARPTEAKPGPWREGHWSGYINFGYEHTPKGHYARLVALKAADSPLLQPLYKTDATFIREFERAFVIAKQPTWGGAIHTGPVGRDVGHNGLWYGHGGGQLATFWTPGSGTIIVGRTRGVQGAVYNLYDEWRSWPAHAVIGLTGRDELVTSNRIQKPDMEQTVGEDRAEIVARGVMPMYNKSRTGTTSSGIAYERRFTLSSEGAIVSTLIKSSEESPWMKELYETIPVYMNPGGKKGPTTIEFRRNGEWIPGTADTQDAVDAVRITRFESAVDVTFGRPRRVQLSPVVWFDGYQSMARVRTVLVDLIEGAERGTSGHGGLPVVVKTSKVTYRIAPVAK
ncbi:MAG: hypothetical protein O3B01_16790 [Planctomycetota bacterium]|nr:hypothetical protein [Planctomycetota bacterium]MDA1140234.1 hypothetical protein [Planctomycetota bacterium]